MVPPSLLVPTLNMNNPLWSGIEAGVGEGWVGQCYQPLNPEVKFSATWEGEPASTSFLLTSHSKPTPTPPPSLSQQP